MEPWGQEQTIAEIAVATVRAEVPEPIRFGDWVMRYREFALVRIRAKSGAEGFAFTLTRDGALAATIKRVIEHHYIGSAISRPDGIEQLFYRCQGSNLAALSGGVGLRALSIVDLATHDLLARSLETPIHTYLGGQPRKLPATAIIGYPPAAMPPEAVKAQVLELRANGWRRFKLPIALPLEYGQARLIAAREAAGDDAWLGMDAAWIFRSVDDAARFLNDVRPVRLGWFEDVFPPGDAEIVAQLKARSGGTPIAMGDEQGGSYYPEALIQRDAVDIVRIDLTCMGGLTRARPLIHACETAGVAFSPHMFAHVHSQVFGALGYDVPIEWGVPGTGVDQYADSLARPTLAEDGLMEPFPPEPGFGQLYNSSWLLDQDADDPDGLIAELGRAG